MHTPVLFTCRYIPTNNDASHLPTIVGEKHDLALIGCDNIFVKETKNESFLETFRTGPDGSGDHGYCTAKSLQTPKYPFLPEKVGMTYLQLKIPRLLCQEWRFANIVVFCGKNLQFQSNYSQTKCQPTQTPSSINPKTRMIQKFLPPHHQLCLFSQEISC